MSVFVAGEQQKENKERAKREQTKATREQRENKKRANESNKKATEQPPPPPKAPITRRVALFGNWSLGGYSLEEAAASGKCSEGAKRLMKGSVICTTGVFDRN